LEFQLRTENFSILGLLQKKPAPKSVANMHSTGLSTRHLCRSPIPIGSTRQTSVSGKFLGGRCPCPIPISAIIAHSINAFYESTLPRIVKDLPFFGLALLVKSLLSQVFGRCWVNEGCQPPMNLTFLGPALGDEKKRGRKPLRPLHNKPIIVLS
jgi:hypothetical protein